MLPALAPATPDAINSPFATLATFPPLWINELQADNLTGITNSAGQRTAWLELYNPSTNTVSLNGLYLANNYTNLTQWAFPTNAAINPGQFKVIFADGQTSLSTTNELHTSFVLPSAHWLTGPDPAYHQRPVASAGLHQLPNLATNYSYGSFPDGQSFVRQAFYHATPGATNDGTTMPPPSFIPYASAGAVYTQNFDSLPNPGAASVNSDNPVTINGITYSLANPFDFAFPAIASGNVGGLGIPALAGWYGMADPTASVGTRFGATDGDQTTGGIISFGLPSSSNRAVGLLATSTTGYTGFGAKFINQTPNTLNSITLQFTGEVWRQSDKPKTLQFYYFIDPTATAPFSTSYTAFLPALNVSFPTVPSDVGGVAVDGTAPANQISLGVTNQVITNWPPGAALWLVWEMTDATGKAQGLGIDNLSFSAIQSQSNANTAPILAPIPNQLVYANTLLTFTASATDTDQPPQTLTFSLGAGAPTGATITSGGVFTWTPTAAQAPSTNTISVIVTDNGVPQMSATNSFTVVVYRPNTPPVLSSIPNQTVYANTLLTLTASATDTDQPPQTLTFSLGTGAPTGASITSGGVFTWTPAAAQAPSTNTISVIVTDSGQPQMSATNSFKVVAYRPNTPPVLATISNQTVYANTLLTFTASATDTDQPPQTLTFSLGTGAPTGASITSGGVFTWTPTAAQAPSTNNISVIVTDSGQPQMSATNSFKVVVYRPNTPPVLAAISNQTVYANTLLTFTASATDTDQPPQTLTFSLGAGAPTGASITSGGVFTWTPTAAQAPSTNNDFGDCHRQRPAADVGYQQFQDRGLSPEHVAGAGRAFRPDGLCQHAADLHRQRDGYGSAAADTDLQPGHGGAHGCQHYQWRRVHLDADGGAGAEHEHDFGDCHRQRPAADVGHQQLQGGGLSPEHAAGAGRAFRPDGLCQHAADLHGQRHGYGSAAADPDLQPGRGGAHGGQHYQWRGVHLDAHSRPGAEHEHDFGDCHRQRRAPDVGHQQLQGGGLSPEHAAGAGRAFRPDGLCQHAADLHGQRDGYGSAAADPDLQPGRGGAHGCEHYQWRRVHLDAHSGPGAEHEHDFGDCHRQRPCRRCRPPTASRWWSIARTRRRCWARSPTRRSMPTRC